MKSTKTVSPMLKLSILLVAILIFCVGFIIGSYQKREPLKFIDPLGTLPVMGPEFFAQSDALFKKLDKEEKIKSQALAQSSGVVVASKNGTAYHLPSCSSANRIKEENKIWFKTIKQAQDAGYKASKSCKGLQ